MSSIRVHELAKELNMSSKEVVTTLQALGVDVKNHLSVVEQSDAERLRSYLKEKLESGKSNSPARPHSSAPEESVSQAVPATARSAAGNAEAKPARSLDEVRQPETVEEEVKRPVRPREEVKRPVRPGEEPKRPVRPGEEAKRPVRPGEDPRRPVRPGEDPRRPARPGEDPRRPVRPGEDPRRPVRPGEDPRRPARPGEDPRRPVRPGEDPRRPVRPGEDPRRPVRPGEEGRRPVRPGEDPRRPARPGEDPRRPVRPGEEGRRPVRPGEDPRRPVRPAEDVKRPEGAVDRPGSERGARRPEDRRPKPNASAAANRADARLATPSVTPAVEQPVKRAVPEKKKVEERDKVFGRKRELEREFKDLPKKPQKAQVKEVRDTTPKHIQIPETITVQDLAQKMSRKAGELIKKLLDLGVLATINQEIDAETATILAAEFGVTVEVKVEKPLTVIEDIEDNPDDLKPRPPVVTVMGHVDHGKTSLLDAIRETNVTASEAGGITQHIGAYQVEVNGQKITFLDTPGHEAFTAMRARGAQVTDIAILVVAADDGVMPQTVEAINHAKAAGVPIVVAINKIDKPDANPDRVKQELTEYGLVVEEWGGDTIAVPVSAKARLNIEQLLEMVLLVAEIKELKANPNRPATGTVIEAQLDKRKGPVATVLVAKGTLEVGDVIVAGQAFGRIRAMADDKGRRVKKAGPSMPVEVLGLDQVPEAGERFYVVADEKLARQIAQARAQEKKAEEAKSLARVSLDDLFDRIKEGEVKDLNLIIKADVHGSVEALKQSLLRLSTSEVRVNPIHGGVGAITETDVMLAAASNAIIIGFNVRPDANTKETADRQGVDIRLYRVIYDAIEDVKAAMTGLLDPDFKEVVLGRAEVRQVFRVPSVGTVAGCYVLNGKILRSAKIRVIRDGVVIHEGQIDSLKRFKDDVREVAESYECGISVQNFNDIKEGDILEAYIMEEVKREL